MEDWTRVLLYGTFEGFGWDTDGNNNILLVLDNGDKVEIPNHFVKDASDFVEKNKIKLKDVTARIKQLDIGTRKVWLDEFLNELGSGYGTMKYKDGYEQGKLESEWVGQQLKDADKIRQELNKPVVKQFVADWYEENKDNLEFNIFDYVYRFDQNAGFDFKDWFDDFNTKPIQTLVNMHQFGYEVEKEKRYRVKVKGMNRINGYLAYNKTNGAWYFGISGNSKNHSTNHTRKELEDAGFGWVFDCEGIEIEEMEG